MKHALVAVLLRTDADPVFACACGALIGGRRQGIWTVTRNADGTARFRPSVNAPGHFHAFFERVPVVGSMTELVAAAKSAS